MTKELQDAIVARLIERKENHPSSLDLSNLKLTTKDLKECIDVIDSVSTLKELDLSGNTEMMELPAEIALLTSLEKLNLSNMGLMDLPATLPGIIELPNGQPAHMVRQHVLPTNQSDLNVQKIGLRKLKELDLSKNAPINLPKYFNALHRLEKLDLSHTLQTEIPDEVLKLGNLKELIYNDNFASVNQEKYNQLRRKGVLIITNNTTAPENNLTNTNAATLVNQGVRAQGPANDLTTSTSINDFTAIGGPAQNRQQQRTRPRTPEQNEKSAKRQRKL